MSLDKLRGQMNDVDSALVELFVERMKIASEIAEQKSKEGIPISDMRREKDVMNRIMDMAGEEFEMYANRLYRTLFEVSKSHQAGILINDTELTTDIKESIADMKMLFPRKATVACQGVEGSYAERACDKLFPMANAMHFGTFEGVFNAVEKGLCQYGVLPIENSSAGSVLEVYDLMASHKFYIVKSLKLNVNHALVVKKGVKRSDIKEIISHEQALRQCSEFLKSFPNAKVTVFANTAAAAKYVSESDRDDIAAISSTGCAKLYGMDILQEAVQNSVSNQTRFICIAKNMEIYAGANKISLIMTLAHKPGALYEMLGKIASHNLNLCKLESRPIGGRDFEFRFYFDIDASVFSDTVLTLLKEMEFSADKMEFLGCYSEG
ncbi:bifunctional chorismate mutase/prephenate dehydratase [Chakrabartyella piscis]|uniref:bifunctional chorismate mutase/prephenate dehydratase n=1 Tax=Chakrabartyella piscis TaxID=2918914 RepID=UPI0029587DFE|nr:prephenate dehydratase domain-containing protein [Chakrabartyella piscis]